MIKQKETILKSRHETPGLCQAHLDHIKQVNVSKIIDSGVSQDDKGHYSWIKVKEWVDEACND